MRDTYVFWRYKEEERSLLLWKDYDYEIFYLLNTL
jgi:hypothetical protein